MKKFTTLALFAIFLTSCTTENVYSPTCPNGDCDAYMEIPGDLDTNGYYHVKLNWNSAYYPYFSINAYADPTSSQYHYNNSPVVSARFDSNLTWTVGDPLVMPNNLYNPFGSDRTSSGVVLPSENITLVLNQFKGTKVNIAQNTELYFSNKGGAKLVTKRILGPFPPESKGDTITVYMKVFWDAGSQSKIKNTYKQKFIVE